ncbi:MAG: helix-turn-helix domain-containing protein [Gemmatimonadota bacterium]
MTTIPIDLYITNVLMADLVGRDRKPSAYLVYLCLTARALAMGRRRTVAVSYQRLSDATGLSRSAVQDAIRVLKRRKLVQVTRAGATATPEYEVLRPWVTR